MSLRKEILKLAKANPDGIRAHLVPILKEAVADKIWKMIGDLKKTPDGSMTLRVGMRSGGNASTLWRKFQMANQQRKLQVTFDDTALILTLNSGRGPAPTKDEEPQF